MENPLIQALLSGFMHKLTLKTSAITNLITDPQIFSPQSLFKDLVYAKNRKHIIQMFSLSVNPIMPLGRDNYLSTLQFLKGVSKSTQAVCLSGDFYSTTSWR